MSRCLGKKRCRSLVRHVLLAALFSWQVFCFLGLPLSRAPSRSVSILDTPRFFENFTLGPFSWEEISTSSPPVISCQRIYSPRSPTGMETGGSRNFARTLAMKKTPHSVGDRLRRWISTNFLYCTTGNTRGFRIVGKAASEDYL